MNTDEDRSRHARFISTALQPTEEQHAIQLATDRTIILEANAGAAKTTTLALRMAESWRRGAAPHSLLALTHTRPACDALKSALSKIGVPVNVARQIRIHTFEAFCTQVLDEVVGATVPIFEKDEQLRQFVWQAIKRVETSDSERWRSELVMPCLGDSGAVEELLKLGTRLKGALRDILERGENSVSPSYADSLGVEYTQLKIFLAYERIRHQENAERPLFRGALDATYDLARWLYEGESVQGLQTWPFATRVLVVDEMHDLNQSMFRVLQEILNTTPSFFCGAGDVDQVLHDAAGADATFMGSAIQGCTQRKVRRYPLTHSHRFGRSLASKAGRIADKPYSSMAAHDTKLSLTGYGDLDECTHHVIETVRTWQAQPRVKMSELAILLRHPHQSVPIENALLKEKIPYTTRGFDSYLMRAEVLFVRGLLAAATNSLGSVAESATREKVMQALVFFSGSHIEVEGREHDSQETLLADAIRGVRDAPDFLSHFLDNHILRTAAPSLKRRLVSAIRIAREHKGSTLLGEVLDALDIGALIRDAYVSRQRRSDALGNIEGLKRSAMGYETAQDYFQSLNDAEQQQGQLKKTASLVIASVASVKGLEFDHVVLPYLAQGEFPAATGTDIEEQNLFYVGMTRARRFLTLQASAQAPSSFIQRMGYTPTASASVVQK